MSFGAKVASSKSTPAPIVPKDLGPIRSQLSSLFRSQLRDRGAGVFTDPGGISGRIFQNLFGDNPANDFLGARSALQDVIGGGGFQKAVSDANQALLPAALSNINYGSSALRTAAGPAGLRYSTDLLGQQQRLANQILLGTQQQAVQTALPFMQQRGDAAQGVFDMAAQLREADLGRLLPLMVAFATQFAPVGNTSSSHSFEASGGFG